jgi:hypothetical protein
MAVCWVAPCWKDGTELEAYATACCCWPFEEAKAVAEVGSGKPDQVPVLAACALLRSSDSNGLDTALQIRHLRPHSSAQAPLKMRKTTC